MIDNARTPEPWARAATANEDCIERNRVGRMVGVRDGKNLRGGALAVDLDTARAFIDETKQR